MSGQVVFRGIRLLPRGAGIHPFSHALIRRKLGGFFIHGRKIEVVLKTKDKIGSFTGWSSSRAVYRLEEQK